MVESTATNPQLLADQVSQLLVQPLEAASVVLSSGPRIFDTSGVLRIPKLTGSSSVGFIGENELIPSDHGTDFQEIVLMPTERKSIKVIERYSRELARQAVIGIDATLKNRLVKVVSDKLDTALLTGRGQAPPTKCKPSPSPRAAIRSPCPIAVRPPAASPTVLPRRPLDRDTRSLHGRFRQRHRVRFGRRPIHRNVRRRPRRDERRPARRIRRHCANHNRG